MLRQLDVETVEVRLPEELKHLDGLIIPGGESTTIGKLAVMYQLMGPLRQFAGERPVWGTCAGMIFMAKAIGMDQPLLGVMDIVVERNAFGRQKDSFQEDVYLEAIKNKDSRPFPGIFIRSPRLVETKGQAVPIARLANGTPVAAVEKKLLATSFHPELTRDLRFHRYFLDLI
jgi:5'-phosphate synthase pdxT subunit